MKSDPSNHLPGTDPSEEMPGIEKQPAGFRVPEGYFESLQVRIADSISKSTHLSGKVQSSLGKMVLKRAWIPVAAAALILAFIVLSPGKLGKQDTISDLHNTLNLNDAYDASYAADAEAHDDWLTQELMDDTGSLYAVDFSTSYYLDNEIEDQDIIEYLEEQDLDTSLLAEL